MLLAMRELVCERVLKIKNCMTYQGLLEGKCV